MFKNKIIFGGLFFLVLVLAGFIFFKKENSKQELVDNKVVNKNKTNLKIGYITDLHCYSKLNSETGKWEVNWRCSEPLSNFTRLMNENFLPDLIVDGGDLVDGRDDHEKVLYPVVLELFKKMNFPDYHLLGNHETRGFLKKDWLEFTNYEKPYYFVDVREYRLIFLDGNNKLVGPDGQSVNTSPEVESYPGFLDLEQKKWLKETLKNSSDKTLLVFVHQPPLKKTLLKNSSELFIEGEEIRNLFTKYGVKAVFSGHIEELCSVEDQGVHYYSLKGVHKDNRQLLEKDARKDQIIFYEININENQEVEIKMFFKEEGSEEYQELIVDSETAYCNNKSVENPEAYKNLVNQQELKEEEAEARKEDEN